MANADLSLDFLRVVESAAAAAAREIGRGRRKIADRQAVEAMRTELSTMPIRGRIVIGEGERDEAPMLFIGEEVGAAGPDHPEIDIAVDPLEGTNLCATGSPNAMAVLAAAPRGGLLHAPDIYMEKIVVGRRCRHVIDLDAPASLEDPVGDRQAGHHRPGWQDLGQVSTRASQIATLTDRASESQELAPRVRACPFDRVSA